MSNSLKKLLSLIPNPKTQINTLPKFVKHLKTLDKSNFEKIEPFDFSLKKTENDLILKIKDIEDISNQENENLTQRKFTLGFILSDLSENFELRGFEYNKIDVFANIPNLDVLKNNFLVVKKGTLVRLNLLFLDNNNTFFLCDFSLNKDLDEFFLL